MNLGNPHLSVKTILTEHLHFTLDIRHMKMDRSSAKYVRTVPSPTDLNPNVRRVFHFALFRLLMTCLDVCTPLYINGPGSSDSAL